MTSWSEDGPAAARPGGSPAAQIVVVRHARSAQLWPGHGRPDRVWRVAANGDIEAVGGPRPAAGPLLVGRVVGRPPRPGRARAELMPALPTPRPRARRIAVAGLSAALVTAGLVLIAVSTGPPPVSAAEAEAVGPSPPDLLQVVPPAPAGDFVYPILPVPAGAPTLPTGATPDLVYPGPIPGPVPIPGLVPGPTGLVPAVPMVPPVPPTSPAVSVPTLPGTVSPPPLREGQGDGGPKPGTGAPPVGPPPTPTPTPLPPAPCTGAPDTPLADMPVEVQLLEFRPERLLRAAGASEDGLPYVDCGGGLGLWAGSTAETSVLVLGRTHPAVQELVPGRPAGRPITVRHGGSPTVTLHRLGETVEITRAAAVELLDPLRRTDAPPPLLILVTVDAATVTVVEAR